MIADVAAMDLVVFVFLDLLLKPVFPVVIFVERSPFLPTFTAGSGQDAPHMGDDQAVSAAGMTGEFVYRLGFHECTPSDPWQQPGKGTAFSLGLVQFQTKKRSIRRTHLVATFTLGAV
jgi:hypothetical protein